MVDPWLSRVYDGNGHVRPRRRFRWRAVLGWTAAAVAVFGAVLLLVLAVSEWTGPVGS
jgi:hypothetical protein